MDNLASLYMQEGRYGEAMPLYERALAINEKVLGPTHPSVAINLNNLAQLFTRQGDYNKAEPLLKRALAIDEKRSGLTIRFSRSYWVTWV